MHKLTLLVCFVVTILYFNKLVAAQRPTPTKTCFRGPCANQRHPVCATNGQRACRVFQNDCLMRKHNCERGESWRKIRKIRCNRMRTGGNPARCRAGRGFYVSTHRG